MYKSTGTFGGNANVARLFLSSVKDRVLVTQPGTFRFVDDLKSEKNGIYWAKRKKKGKQILLAKRGSVLSACALPTSQTESQVSPMKRRGQASPCCRQHRTSVAPP